MGLCKYKRVLGFVKVSVHEAYALFEESTRRGEKL